MTVTRSYASESIVALLHPKFAEHPFHALG